MLAQPRWIALGTVVATAAALLAGGCTPDGGDAAATCAPAKPPAAAGTVDSAGIKVAEQGFTAVPDEFPRVSIGAVLENTTDRVAYRTRVVFDALGASGTVIAGPQTGYTMIEVPVIAPGAKVAVGDTLVATERAEVTRVTITPAVTAWMPAGDADDGLAPVTGAIVPGSGKVEADGSTRFGFTARGDNCTALVSRGLGFVWRDAAGQIVGGNIDAQDKIYACEPDGEDRPEQSVSAAKTVPPAAVLDRTEITPFCDLQPYTGVIQAGQPVN